MLGNKAKKIILSPKLLNINTAGWLKPPQIYTTIILQLCFLIARVTNDPVLLPVISIWLTTRIKYINRAFRGVSGETLYCDFPIEAHESAAERWGYRGTFTKMSGLPHKRQYGPGKQYKKWTNFEPDRKRVSESKETVTRVRNYPAILRLLAKQSALNDLYS